MTQNVSLDMEYLCRRAGLYTRINSFARGTRKLTRKLAGNRGTLVVSVSPKGFIRIDLSMTNDHYYARFDSKQELVYGGGTTICWPGQTTQHHTDIAVLTMLRTVLEIQFGGIQHLDGLPLVGECSRYRLVAGCMKNYYA